MHKRFTGWLAAVALSLFALALPAQAQLVVGRDYVPVDPVQTTDTPAKIEVIEFFSYGCPHCSDFHPVLGKWTAKLPSDVVLKRVPIAFGRTQWLNLAKLYHALELTGDLARVDALVFQAIHEKNVRLGDDSSIISWVGTQGVDAKKFADAYNSFGVVSKAKRGDQLAQIYKISGVPAQAMKSVAASRRASASVTSSG